MRDMPDISRYHRQALLREIGEAGQRRLLSSHALVIGCGALGTVSAEILVRAGVGRVTVVDRDVVEATNLQRQFLFDESDARAGLPKAEAARRRLSSINSEVKVRGVVRDFTSGSAEGLATEGGGVGVIVDGTDNFEARYLMNDVSVKTGTPWVYGAAVGMTGMSMTVVPGVTGCLRCLFEEPPESGSAAASETCETVGVFGAVTALIGSVQAGEALKILAVGRDAAAPGLLSVDAWTGVVRRIGTGGVRRSDCPCCGGREFPFLSGARGSQSVVLCGRGSVQVTPGGGGRIELAALAERLRPHGSFEVTRFLVRGVLAQERGDAGAVTLTVFADGRAIVGGVTRVEAARALYARYVGS
ncbi:MAG: ThiF family adenylyltransferase [Phycisphaerae bacterium]|nr:ThiF family adenylyltransferase [Phycisphaerae bacterium]